MVWVSVRPPPFGAGTYCLKVNGIATPMPIIARAPSITRSVWPVLRVPTVRLLDASTVALPLTPRRLLTITPPLAETLSCARSSARSCLTVISN